MNEDIIPGDLRRFILLNINSVAELECLLLFYNAPEWQADETSVARKLYITEREARLILTHLVERNFLGRTETEIPLYIYRPAFADLTEVIRQLAQFYAQYLVPVTNLIHSKSKNRVQKFADAFWIRKD